jgi:CTP:molybdopterin cytidylyltransferase MocA
MRVRVTAVVPAAGRSSRFGGMKLLAPVAGEPLLQHTLRSLLDGGVDEIVLVAAPDVSFAAVPLAADPRVRLVANEQPDRGMFSSIQTGLAAVPGGPDVILVLPADMPFVKASTVAAVGAAAQSERVIVPLYEGRRGHPIALPVLFRRALLDADPTRSLKDALRTAGAPLVELSVDDPGVLRDVDVREDLEGS